MTRRPPKPAATGSVQVYLNDGRKLPASPAIEIKGDSAPVVAVRWGDINRDGALDLAVGRYGAPASVYFNQRSSTPAGLLGSIPWTSAETGRVADIALGDLDNNGGLDLVVADFGANGGIRVYLNRGNGYAASASYTIPSANAYSLALGDMDGDGYPDLAVGTSGGPKRGLPQRRRPAPGCAGVDVERRGREQPGRVERRQRRRFHGFGGRLRDRRRGRQRQ